MQYKFYNINQSTFNLHNISQYIAQNLDLESSADIMMHGACLGLVHYAASRMNDLLDADQHKTPYKSYDYIPETIIAEITPRPSNPMPLAYLQIFESMFFQNIFQVEEGTRAVMASTRPIQYVLGKSTLPIVLDKKILYQDSIPVCDPVLELQKQHTNSFALISKTINAKTPITRFPRK